MTFLETPVAEIMTREVMTCSQQDKLVDLMQRMTEGKFRHFPGIEERRLVAIRAITVPTLVLHGELDRVVPIAFGERLYAAIRAPKRFVRFAKGEHEGLDAHGAIAAVRDFPAAAPANLD